MQVNVFVARQDGALQNKLLVLPTSPEASIPSAFRESWRYYATADSTDALFGKNVASVEAELAARGFAFVPTCAGEARHVDGWAPSDTQSVGGI